MKRVERETSKERRESRYANSKSHVSISKESKLKQLSKRESSRSKNIRTESNDRRTAKTSSEPLKAKDRTVELSRQKPGRPQEKKNTLGSNGRHLSQQDRSRDKNEHDKIKANKRSQSKDSSQTRHTKSRSLADKDKPLDRRKRTENKINSLLSNTTNNRLKTNDRKVFPNDVPKQSSDRVNRSKSHNDKRRDSKISQSSDSKQKSTRHRTRSKSHHLNGTSSLHQENNLKESSHELVTETAEVEEALPLVEEKEIVEIKSGEQLENVSDAEIKDDFLQKFGLRNEDGESENEVPEDVNQNGSGEDYNYDEEEFEDYDSDFEDESDLDKSEEPDEYASDSSTSERDDKNVLVKEEISVTTKKRHSALADEKINQRDRSAESRNVDCDNNDINLDKSDNITSEKSEVQESFEDDILQRSNDSSGLSHYSDFVRLSSSKKRGITNQPEEKNKFSEYQELTAKNLISFSQPQKREKQGKLASKIWKRADELADLITLDTNFFDIFDLSPVNYEVYIRNFGQINAKQVCIQTDGYSEAESQTIEIVHRQKWTQFPSYYDMNCSGEDITGENELLSWEFHVKTDVLKLYHFLQSVEPVITTLLQESGAEIYRKNLIINQANISFSDGFTHLVPPSFRKDCPITYVKFSNIQENYLLTIHGSPTTTSKIQDLDDKGIICVWNLFVPSFPDKILCCASQPLCACFSPVKANLIFAGMVDGSVAVWDLAESNMKHENYFFGDRSCAVRTPSYCTAEVLREEGHLSAVISVKPVLYGNSRSSPVNNKSNYSAYDGASSFEIATLEENAIVKFWIVIEEVHQEVHGSLTDLGLAPNAKIKLVLSSTINAQTFAELNDDLKCGMKAHDLEFNPCFPNHLYVATDAGSILHHTKNGVSAIPKLYVNDTGLLCDIQSIDFSPHNLPYFLAGCSDGTVHLFSARSAKPLMTWSSVTGGVPVLTVKWSRSQPSLFYALDITSKVHVWDLSLDNTGPCESCHFSQGRIMSFDLSIDFDQQTSTKPAVAFAMDDSSVEVHQISKNFSSVPEDRFHQLSVNVTSL